MHTNSDGLTLHSSVEITEDCPMRFRAYDDGAIEFRGGEREEFDLSFDLTALRRFIELGTRALTQAEAEHSTNHPDVDGNGTKVDMA